MTITQTMEYEGYDYPSKKLMADLKEFHQTTPFKTGIDWQWQYYWATMTDEQALMFILKHPEYKDGFRKTGE
jgi:hypothetical protein